MINSRQRARFVWGFRTRHACHHSCRGSRVGCGTTPRRLWLVTLLCLFASLLAVPTTRAHEARPAYLEIKETSPNQFSVLWRTPVLAGMRLRVVLTMPGDVKNLKEPVVQELADSLLERRWIDAGPNGLAGKQIQFRGLQLTITDVLVRVEMLDGRTWTTIAHPSQPWVQIVASQTWLGVAGAYLRLAYRADAS